MFYDNHTCMGEVQKRSPYLMKFMLTVWEKIYKKRNLRVWPKEKDICWYTLVKVVALKLSSAAIPGTENYFMDIGQ